MLLGSSLFTSPQGLKMTQQRWEEMDLPPRPKRLFLGSLQNHQARLQKLLINSRQGERVGGSGSQGSQTDTEDTFPHTWHPSLTWNLIFAYTKLIWTYSGDYRLQKHPHLPQIEDIFLFVQPSRTKPVWLFRSREVLHSWTSGESWSVNGWAGPLATNQNSLNSASVL